MSDARAYSDETLSAYLDGELPPDQRAALELELGRDPALREQLERFRGVMALMRQEFGDETDEPVPETLIQAARDLANGQRTATNVTPLPQRARAPALGWRLPLAACIALVIGGIAGGTFQSWRDAEKFGTVMATLDAGRIESTNPLHAALESAPSGTSVTTADRSRLHMILTFAAKDGRYCREFDVATARAASVGVACRDNESWRVEILLAAKPQDLGGYQPASGYNARAFDDVVSALMKDDPLALSKERELIATGWR